MNQQIYQNFSCHDGCLASVVGRKQRNGKWGLYSVSEVMGMGMAKYENHILDTYYDEVVGLNSHSGLSYIATKQNNRWGLIQIRDNGKVKSDWKVIAENIYDSLDFMLAEFNINRQEYYESKERGL